MIKIPVSAGELIDKITILKIKQEKIDAPDKRENIKYELNLLQKVHKDELMGSAQLTELTDALRAVNDQLWKVEDDIREQEQANTFEERFVELARSVYVLNDERARLKREISLLLGSNVIEEKSYHSVLPG